MPGAIRAFLAFSMLSLSTAQAQTPTLVQRTAAAVSRIAHATFDHPVTYASPDHVERESSEAWSLRLARRFHQQAAFEQAAFWYELHALHFSGSARAPQSLAEAIALRLALGDEAEAARDAREFSRSFGVARPEQDALLQLSIASHHARREQWEQARPWLSAVVLRLDRTPLYPERIEAHTLLGRALESSGDERAAVLHYQRARNVIRQAPLAQETHAERVAQALDPAGEALFRLAERARWQAERIALPRYQGPPARKDISEYLLHTVVDWHLRRARATTSAVNEYAAVLTLEPSPPRWVIASAERAGHLWAEMFDTLRSLPRVPRAHQLERPESWFAESLDHIEAPYEERARDAFKVCLETAIRHRLFDEHASACERWLARLHRAEFHPFEEFHDAAVRLPLAPASVAPLPLGASGLVARQPPGSPVAHRAGAILR